AAPDASEYQLTSYVMVHSLLGALLCWTGFLDRGLAMASRGVELARRSKNIDSLTWQLVWMLAVRSARDEVAEYSAAAEELDDLSQAYGFPDRQVIAVEGRGYSLARKGLLVGDSEILNRGVESLLAGIRRGDWACAVGK